MKRIAEFIVKYRFPLTLLLFTGILYLPLILIPETYPYTGDLTNFCAMFECVRKTILEYGEFPHWLVWFGGGMPGAADPYLPVLGPELPFILVFGPFYGVRLAVWLEMLAGVFGMWMFLGDLTKNDWARFWGAALFIGSGAFMAHFLAAHFPMAVVWIFPWLLWCMDRFSRGWKWGAAAGLAAGIMLNHSLHYCTLIMSVFAGISGLFLLARVREKRPFLLSSLCGLCVCLAVCGYRVVVTLDYIRDYPRIMNERVLIRPDIFLNALLNPFQTLWSMFPTGSSLDWNWFEIVCYIGICAAATAAVSFFRKWTRFHWAAFAALLLTVDNSCMWLPGYWIARIPPFTSMFVITRWRFFLVFFLSAVLALEFARLLRKYPEKRKLLLILPVVSCLGLAANRLYLCFLDPGIRPVTFEKIAVLRVKASAPIVSLNVKGDQVFAAVRSNIGVITGYQNLRGYNQEPPRLITPADSPDYRGEFFSEHGRAKLLEWSPNRLKFQCSEPDVVTIAQNPGSCWFCEETGEYLFPQMKAFDPQKKFQFRSPAGTWTFRLRPRLHTAGILVSLAGLLGSLVFLLAGLKKGKSNIKLN